MKIKSTQTEERVTLLETDLGDELTDRGTVEIGGVTRVPLAVTLIEPEFHEVAGDGGEEHVAGLATNGVVELEDFVVAGMSLSHSHVLIPREDGGHRPRHRGLLRHVQNVHCARTPYIVQEGNKVLAIT